jgi:hypothetical protein
MIEEEEIVDKEGTEKIEDVILQTEEEEDTDLFYKRNLCLLKII